MSNRKAEISVPACPIPIHQTKLTMANPQAMGILIPQRPTPITSSAPIAIFKIMKKVKATANPNHHPRLVFCSRTMELILSVIVA